MTAEPLSLAQLGWSDERARRFEPMAAAGLVPGRVVTAERGLTVVTATGPSAVVIQRRSRRELLDPARRPAIGDWLALEPMALGTASPDVRQLALRAVLDRAGTLTRARGSGEAQVLAANVDVAFLVSGLDHDLNLRRMERYVSLAREGRVEPVIVLNKADVAADPVAARQAVGSVAPGVDVLVSSATQGKGVEPLRAAIGAGRTACLLGSSGVGKSTLTNALLGRPVQDVAPIRLDDGRGRHTTTRRELFVLEGGGLLIDTPGLRSVGILGDGEGLASAFGDIETLAAACRFRDCTHRSESGCEVRPAVEDGRLDPRRLDSQERLMAELRSAERRADVRARREHDRRLGRLYRDVARHKVRGDEPGGD